MSGEMGLLNFVEELHADVTKNGKAYALFLGAGCSISSGIESAAKLARDWMKDVEPARIQGYDEADPARSYAAVLRSRFPSAGRRHSQIRKLCEAAKPGFGYAALARLMVSQQRLNLVVTTNFDDLLVEALYLYTTTKPLVVPHEILVPTVTAQIDAKTPTIIKLHGDAHFDQWDPKKGGLPAFTKDTKTALNRLLAQRCVVFLGYSGNDGGVADALGEFKPGELPEVYWVNEDLPGAMLREWLEAHEYKWVKHRDFDQLMTLIHHEFNLPLPVARAFGDDVFQCKHQLLRAIADLAVPKTFTMCRSIFDAVGTNQWLDDERLDHPQNKRLAGEYRRANGFLRAEEEMAKFQKENDWKHLARAAGHYLDIDCVSAVDKGLPIFAKSFPEFVNIAEFRGACADYVYQSASDASNSDGGHGSAVFDEAFRLLPKFGELDAAHEKFLREKDVSGVDDNAPMAPGTEGAAMANDDVVISVHPITRNVWTTVLPEGAQLHLREFHVETPPERWHQTEPSTSRNWNLVRQRIDDQLNKLQNTDCRRIHVFARAPYSLGGFLGNQLDQRFRGGRELVFYQFNENSEAWEDWGPNRRQPVSPRDEPFLKMSRVDGAPEGSERGEARHIVVAIHISQRLSEAELGTVLALADAQRIDIAPVNGVNQSALQDAGSVDRCVRDLRKILFQIATENPRAKLHVFYLGPLVVWMRASSKLHLLPVPAVLYERVFEEGRFRFVPGLELQQQKLLMGAPVAGQQGDASGAAPAALPPRLRVLAVADEWESKKGGLSTFNRLLCKALAQAGHEVLCLVPGASEEEHRKASDAGVRLVEADALKLPDIARICLKPLNVTLAPHVIIGHGRVTGEAARIQARTHFPGSLLVHFIHTASGHIEWFKGDLLAEDASRKVDERTADEVRLASMADLVVGVGPVLTNAAKDEIHTGAQKTVPIHRFDPGLIDINPVKTHPQKIRCLLLGRAEDRRLKGIDIAVRALGALRDPPELVIRGVPPGEAVEFTQWVNSQAKTVEVRPFEYSAQEETIAADIRKASLVLMPSRAEGFGLVGLEAISAAVPVLVSNQSGLGEILQNDVRTDAAKCAVVLTSGVDDETNIAAWSQAIKSVLFDRIAAYKRAVQLREDVAKVLDWANSVKKLVAELQKIVDTRASAGTPST